MCACLKHRGPDASGAQVFNRALSAPEGLIGMGHRRLSIIDLSENARQPMKDETGRYVIVFNGEIYNFKEIKAILIKRYPIDFASRSDTEVLLYAFIHLREKCLDLLNGMFAFAIVDLIKNELFLARDRMGVKPLYYYCKNGEFAFASIPRALFEYLSQSFAINTPAFNEYFIQGYIGGTKSIARDVHQLAPGHWMKIAADGVIENRRFWDLNPDAIREIETASVDNSELSSELGSLLSDSIKLRLVSDVPIGVFLSGGIDSTLVAALACKESISPVKTFTVGFQEKLYDESAFAKSIAQWLRTEHHELIVGEKDFLAILPYFNDAFDEPFADESAIPTLILSKFAREKITVALSGDGGDEQYFGYTKYDHLRRLQRIYSVPFFLRGSFLSMLPKKLFNFDTRIKLQSLCYRTHAECINNLVNPFTVLPDLHNGNIGALMEGNQTLPGLASENQWMIKDFKGYMTEDVLTKVDRASMRFGLEVRTPLLDYRFVQGSFYNVPLALKRRGEKKKILKKMLEPYVPKDLFERPKMGFAIPLKQWINGALNEEIAALLTQSSFM
jgi:asparagine synthase (glutamine-hydrolysing)